MSSGQPDSHRLPTQGQRLGDYVIEEVLGRGGMGTVFVARHPQLGARRALKVQRLQTRLHQERFAREARALAKVDRHPGVVRIHEHGLLAGSTRSAYVVMDLIDGPTLAGELRTRGPMTLERASLLCARLAEALAHVHAAGITHRDLKPENVLLRTEDDQPLLSDFGLARDEDDERLTATGQLLGTLQYMSPEQAGGSKTVGPPSDVFALGLVLYELLTGEVAFEADSPYELLRRIISTEPIPLLTARSDLPPDIGLVLERVLAKTPGDRPTASELAEWLHRLAQREPLNLGSAPRAWPMLAGGVLALVLVIGVAAYATQASSTTLATLAPSSQTSDPQRPSAVATPNAAQTLKAARQVRRARIAAGRARLAAKPSTAGVTVAIRSCARLPTDPPDDVETRAQAVELIREGIRFVLQAERLEATDLVELGFAMANVGVRLGRDPLTRQLLPFFSTWFSRMTDEQLGRLYTDYLRLDLPIDMAGGLPTRLMRKLPDATEARFLLLRNRIFAPFRLEDEGRAAMLRYVVQEGEQLGPIARAHALWLAAGVGDLPAPRQLELAEEALALDPQSVYATGVHAVALARSARIPEAKAALDRAVATFGARSFSLDCARCWVLAYAGDAAGLDAAQRVILQQSVPEPIKRELVRGTTRVLRSVERTPPGETPR